MFKDRLNALINNDKNKNSIKLFKRKKFYFF